MGHWAEAGPAPERRKGPTSCNVHLVTSLSRACICFMWHFKGQEGSWCGVKHQARAAAPRRTCAHRGAAGCSNGTNKPRGSTNSCSLCQGPVVSLVSRGWSSPRRTPGVLRCCGVGCLPCLGTDGVGRGGRRERGKGKQHKEKLVGAAGHTGSTLTCKPACTLERLLGTLGLTTI